MRTMDALSIRYNSSLSTDRAQARAGDSHASSGIDVACPTTQRVIAIASPHESHGSSSLSSSTGTSSFCCNQQYSVTAITTSTGAIAERYAYSAYGQPTILDASASVLSSLAINNRYTYTGREWDATLAGCLATKTVTRQIKQCVKTGIRRKEPGRRQPRRPSMECRCFENEHDRVGYKNGRCRSNIECLRKCQLKNPWNDKIRALCSPS
jgi:hypothetical protein